MKLRFVLVAVAGLLLAADARDDGKKDTKRVQGTWNASSIQFSGTQLIGDSIKELQVTIDGDTMTVKGDYPDSDQYNKMTIKLDPSTDPRLIDVTLATGNDKGLVMEGIYKLNGDELQLCMKLFVKQRPTEFGSKPDSNIVLAVFKRAK